MASRTPGAASRKPARARVWMVALTLICAATSSAAQAPRSEPPAPDTLYLTMEQAITEALTNNPAYRRAENNLRLNPVESRNTWLNQLLPQTRISLLNTTYSGNLQRIATDNFGDPISRPDARWTYFSGTTQSLSFGWQTQGPSVFYRHRSQEMTNLGRELGLGRADRVLRISVQRFYMNALEQAEVVAAERTLVEAREIDLDVVEELYVLALRSRVDVLQAELAVEQQRAVLRRAEGDYDQALLALTSYIGMDPSDAVALSDEPAPAFDPSSLSADALVSQSVDQSPDMRDARFAIDQARLRIAENKTRWWPSLTMSANIYRRSQGVERSSLFDLSFDEDLDYSFYVGLSLPLLDNFFADDVERESAAVGFANQIESERETRLNLERTVRSALLALENQWGTLRLEEEALRIAVEALGLAREEYRLGSRSYTELRSSIESEANARRSVITARFAFHEALLTLEEAVGGEVGTAAQGGN